MGDASTEFNIHHRFKNMFSSMTSEIPSYAIFRDGNAFKASPLYKSIWNHFRFLMDKWKEDSPRKFKISQINSNSKSTIDSEEKIKNEILVTNGNQMSPKKKSLKWHHENEVIEDE